MSGVPGSRKPSKVNLSKAEAVLEATKLSGNLYRNGLGMIASENIVSPMVQKVVCSDLHGRYAEGLPGKRYYQGCDDFDTIESIGIDLALKVFGANFANIQSTSGTVSNIDTNDGIELLFLVDGSEYPASNSGIEPVFNFGHGHNNAVTTLETHTEYFCSTTTILSLSENDYIELAVDNIGSSDASINRGHLSVALLN